MLSASAVPWEISDMPAAEELRGRALYDALMRLKPDNLLETDWAVKAKVNRGFFSDLKTKPISPRSDTLRKVLRQIGRTEADLYGEPSARPPTRQWAGSNPQPDLHDDDLDVVEIQHLDLAFGLGATYTDAGAEQVQLERFPRAWVETITRSPAELLTWTRGRGESMGPTINDGDLVLLDRSQRTVREQDAMWAFTIGDVASIKRLRVKGDRYIILSDNDNVPPDEEPIDFVNIVARVVFIGRRV